MKRLISTALAAIMSIIITTGVYAETSKNFSHSILTEDGKLLSTVFDTSYITLSNTAQNILQAEDGIYLTMYNFDSYINYLYKYTNDMRSSKLVATIPYYDQIMYYDGDIYYTVTVYDKDISLYRINAINGTSELITNIDYAYSYNIYGIYNGYIYYSTDNTFDDYKEMIYKQSISNPLDKSLIFVTEQGIVYDSSMIYNNLLYLITYNNLYAINLDTNKIKYTYKKENHLQVLGVYEEMVYVEYGNRICKLLENNIIEPVSQPNKIIYNGEPTMLGSKIIYENTDWDEYYEDDNYVVNTTTYEYDIETDTWSTLYTKTSKY